MVEFTWIEIKNAWEKIELIRSSDEPIQSLEDEKLIKDEILIKTYSLDVNGSKEANFNIKKGNILIKAQNGKLTWRSWALNLQTKVRKSNEGKIALDWKIISSERKKWTSQN